MGKDLEPATPERLVLAARERGSISPASVSALTSAGVDEQLTSALEGSYGVKNGGKILLMTTVPDDSLSMELEEKVQSVIMAYNALLGMMNASPEGRRVLLQTRFLNGRVYQPFTPLQFSNPMSIKDYTLSTLGTPLYRQSLVTLGAVIAKAEELRAQGATVKTATLIMTDGEADDESEAGRSNLAGLIADLRGSGDHVVAGMGFGHSHNFRTTFEKMGIETKNVFTANSREELIKLFMVFGENALELTRGSS